MSEKKVIAAVEAVRNRIKYYEGMPWKNRKESLLEAMAKEDTFELAAITFELADALFVYAITQMFFKGKTQHAKNFLIEFSNKKIGEEYPNLVLVHKITSSFLRATTILQTEQIDCIYYIAIHTKLLTHTRFSDVLAGLLTEEGKPKWAKRVRETQQSYYQKKEKRK